MAGGAPDGEAGWSCSHSDRNPHKSAQVWAYVPPALTPPSCGGAAEARLPRLALQARPGVVGSQQG